MAMRVKGSGSTCVTVWGTKSCTKCKAFAGELAMGKGDQVRQRSIEEATSVAAEALAAAANANCSQGPFVEIPRAGQDPLYMSIPDARKHFKLTGGEIERNPRGGFVIK